MIISIDGENTLYKIKQVIMMKSHGRLRIEGNFFSLTVEHLYNTTANITFYDYILNEFP